MNSSQLANSLVVLAGLVTAMGFGYTAVREWRRRRTDREREAALQQALSDHTRTGALTWPLVTELARRHKVAEAGIPRVLTAFLQHVWSHRLDYGNGPVENVQHLLEAWQLEVAVAELPPSLAPAVHELQRAIPGREPAVHKLVTQLRDYDRANRTRQQQQRRQLWRWRVLAVALPTAMAAWGPWFGQAGQREVAPSGQVVAGEGREN